MIPEFRFPNPVNLQLAAPVTLLFQSGRPRVVGAAPVKLTPETGTPRTLSGFDCCFAINPVTRTIHAHLPPLPRALLVYGPQDFDSAAADTPDQHAERVLQILGNDPAPILQALIDGTPIADPPIRVPREIANWRAKTVLASMGKLDSVASFLASLPEPERTAATLAWNGDAKVMRKSPMVAVLADFLRLSEADLDALFIAAAALEI